MPRRRGVRRWRGPAPRGAPGAAGAAVGAAALVALAAWPLVSGRAPERQLAFDVPPYWRGRARDLDRPPDEQRALVLPGQLFAYYRLGRDDRPDPARRSRDHPVATRRIVPFADLRATELQWARRRPDQPGARCCPASSRRCSTCMGVGDLVVAADGDRSRSGEAPVGRRRAAARRWAARLAYGHAPGARARRPPAADRSPAPRRARAAAHRGADRRDRARAAARAVDRRRRRRGRRDAAWRPSARSTRAARCATRPTSTRPATCARPPAAGGAFVITRHQPPPGVRRLAPARRARAVARRRPAASESTARCSTRSAARPGAQTVARPARRRERDASPFSPQITQFPEHRPFAALDGDPATAWLADRALATAAPPPDGHLRRRRATSPRRRPAALLRQPRGRAARSRSAAAGSPSVAGWNRLRGAAAHVGSLTVRTDEGDAAPRHAHRRRRRHPRAAHPRRARDRGAAPAGVDRDGAARRATLRADALTYLLERTTADVPRTPGRYAGERGRGRLRDAQDPEPAAAPRDRPAGRAALARSTAGRASTRAPRPVLDRLAVAGPRPGRGAGVDLVLALRGPAAPPRLGRVRRHPAAARGSGSGSPGGRRGWRGTPRRRPRSAAFVLVPPAVRVRRPTRVRPDRRRPPGPALAVGPDGAVGLPRPVRGARFRLDVLDARFPPGTPARDRQRRAVGIGEIRGAGCAARVALARGGGCGSRAARRRSRSTRRARPLAAVVDRAALDAGPAAAARPCGTARARAARRAR